MMKLITRKTPWTAKTPLPFAWTCKYTQMIKTYQNYSDFGALRPMKKKGLNFPGKSENSRIKTIFSLGRCPMPGWSSLSATFCAICTCK